MNALRTIRKDVFRITQLEFAALAGVSQSAVSRWESGVEPTLEEVRKIRQAAACRGISPEVDRLLFEAPEKENAA